MSLWIVDGGIGFTLPVIARVEDWKEGEHIDVTGAGDDGKWLPMPVRYVSLSSVHDGQREMADRIERLESENAKLRELVQDIYVLCWHGMDCTECPWFDECDTDGRCPWLSIMHDHMCELGVEVAE